MYKYLLSAIFLLRPAMAQIRTSDTAFIIQSFTATGNPIINHAYTADAAALVVGDSVYLYTGHDEAAPKENRYVMQRMALFLHGRYGALESPSFTARGGETQGFAGPRAMPGPARSLKRTGSIIGSSP